MVRVKIDPQTYGYFKRPSPGILNWEGDSTTNPERKFLCYICGKETSTHHTEENCPERIQV
jgi:hypothetical protein